MATPNEEWLDNWQGSARKAGRRAIWVTLAFLLPAILLAVGLTRFSVEAVDERDRQIAVLNDSLALLTDFRPAPQTPLIVDTVDTLGLRLLDENKQLQDSLALMRDSLSRLLNAPEQPDDARNQLEELRKRLLAAQSTNKELCGSLSELAATLQRLSLSRKADTALIGRLSIELEKDQSLCNRLLRQLSSIR